MIRAVEIANVCAIFPSLRTSRLSNDELIKLVQDTKVINSDNSVDSILSACVDSGLLLLESGQYHLTQKGLRLSRSHNKPEFQLSEKAKELFIKYVLLDIESEKWCCGEFISQFKVDSILETFVYDRNSPAVKDDTNWLISLSSVGLIKVDKEKALINRKYLGIVNEMLLKISNPLHVKIGELDKEKKKVGDLSESLAMRYEMERLSIAGFSSLAPLVQQISKVNQSAGYDILSFHGTGKDPSKNVYIEIKGTKLKDFSFYWSYNEMIVAKKERGKYWVYGYTGVDLVNECAEGPIVIKDPISNLERFGYMISPLDCYISKEPI